MTPTNAKARVFHRDLSTHRSDGLGIRGCIFLEILFIDIARRRALDAGKRDSVARQDDVRRRCFCNCGLRLLGREGQFLASRHRKGTYCIFWSLEGAVGTRLRLSFEVLGRCFVATRTVCFVATPPYLSG